MLIRWNHFTSIVFAIVKNRLHYNPSRDLCSYCRINLCNQLLSKQQLLIANKSNINRRLDLWTFFGRMLCGNLWSFSKTSLSETEDINIRVYCCLYNSKCSGMRSTAPIFMCFCENKTRWTFVMGDDYRKTMLHEIIRILYYVSVSTIEEFMECCLFESRKMTGTVVSRSQNSWNLVLYMVKWAMARWNVLWMRMRYELIDRVTKALVQNII